MKNAILVFTLLSSTALVSMEIIDPQTSRENKWKKRTLSKAIEKKKSWKDQQRRKVSTQNVTLGIASAQSSILSPRNLSIPDDHDIRKPIDLSSQSHTHEESSTVSDSSSSDTDEFNTKSQIGLEGFERIKASWQEDSCIIFMPNFSDASDFESNENTNTSLHNSHDSNKESQVMPLKHAFRKKYKRNKRFSRSKQRFLEKKAFEHQVPKRVSQYLLSRRDRSKIVSRKKQLSGFPPLNKLTGSATYVLHELESMTGDSYDEPKFREIPYKQAQENCFSDSKLLQDFADNSQDNWVAKDNNNLKSLNEIYQDPNAWVSSNEFKKNCHKKRERNRRYKQKQKENILRKRRMRATGKY